MTGWYPVGEAGVLHGVRWRHGLREGWGDGCGLTRNSVMIAKGLELALCPGVENPILDVEVGILGLVLSLVPRSCNLGDECVLARLCRVLDIDTLLLQIARQLVVVPVLVGADGIVFPVGLDEFLKILAVGRGGVGDVMVGEPALELGLMPLVVS